MSKSPSERLIHEGELVQRQNRRIIISLRGFDSPIRLHSRIILDICIPTPNVERKVKMRKIAKIVIRFIDFAASIIPNLMLDDDWDCADAPPLLYALFLMLGLALLVTMTACFLAAAFALAFAMFTNPLATAVVVAVPVVLLGIGCLCRRLGRRPWKW